MEFDFFWTDICFLMLLMVSLCLVVYGLRKQPIRASLSIILHKPVAVSAGIVLFLFLIIGVLDSIHFKTTREAGLSLLDKLLAPASSTYEKTYSEPMALHSFISETEIKNGVISQVYPRLEYPPAFIQTEEDKISFIHSVIWSATKVSIMLMLGLGGLFKWINLKFRLGKTSRFNTTQWSVIVTLGVVTFAGVTGYQLSRSLHVFGTGQIGQDLFYYSIKSIRTGLIIGFLTTLFTLPFALILGVASGYFGGIVDDVIQYCYTTLSSVPGVLLITASVLSLQTYITNHPDEFPTLAEGADARLLALCVILGVTSWTSLCRLLRAETLKLRESDFILAARALGSSWITIIRKHLLPNVMHIVVINLVLDFSFLVMAEAVLSYVGVGVSPMTMSWGNMIDGARLELARDPVVWWPMLAAFVFMFMLVLAINLFADAVQDAFDPHQSH